MVTDTAYRPRNPEDNPVYGVVAGHRETFLADQRQRDRHVPAFVEREFRQFLDCGVLARGFLRVHCRNCGLDRLVAYSCKKRCVCSCCGGRRMADTAAHLVDRVFPRVPVRQWVLSLPYALRYRLAFDTSLMTAVLGVFSRTVFAFLIRRARGFGADRKPQCGAVTFIQRFGSALNLHPHLHMLCVDGVWAADEQERPHFQVLLAPENDDIAGLTALLAERITKRMARRGLGPESDPEESDGLRRDEPFLAGLYTAAVSGRTAWGPNAGRRVTRIGDQIDPESVDWSQTPRCAAVDGFSLHANVAVHGDDRLRLERLVRYCARPPIAMERLERLADGRLRYRFKRPWRDGTTHIVLGPLELLEKLSALVPAPRAHLVRYSGVLAPASKWRSWIVPAAAGVQSPTVPDSVGVRQDPLPMPEIVAAVREFSSDELPLPQPAAVPHGRNYSWAELLRRVWEFDVLECPRCLGRMKIVAAIHAPDTITRILDSLGLPSRAPPIAPAALGTAALDWC